MIRSNTSGCWQVKTESDKTVKSFVFFFVTLVLRVKVLSLQLSSPYKDGIYTLEVSQIFSAPNKGVSSIPWPRVFLQTPSSAIDTRLDKTLELGVEYVLTGDIKPINQTVKVMTMNRCSWYKKWKDMSTDDKKELLDKSCNEDSDNDNFP